MQIKIKELEEENKTQIIDFLEQKEQEILAKEQIQQQLKMPEAFSQLEIKHFPLFVTVQKLVYMLDASLYRSFFSRSYDGKIVGMDSNLGWHGEEAGVFMINHDFKRTEETKQEL